MVRRAAKHADVHETGHKAAGTDAQGDLTGESPRRSRTANIAGSGAY